MKTKKLKGWGVVHTKLYEGKPLTDVFTSTFAKARAEGEARKHFGAVVVPLSVTYTVPDA